MIPPLQGVSAGAQGRTQTVASIFMRLAAVQAWGELVCEKRIASRMPKPLLAFFVSRLLFLSHTAIEFVFCTTGTPAPVKRKVMTI